MKRKGKNYQEAFSQVDKHKLYDIKEALELILKIRKEKFDPTIEMAFDLNLNPRRAEQNLRGAMVLPHGTGKTQKVLVIAEGAKAEEAKKAGADLVGADEMIEEIQGGFFDFDIIVATPDMMGKLGRLGRVLGPKGLMPNPKTGTVTMNVEEAVKNIKAGQVEYRVDQNGNINVGVGKASFGVDKLLENTKAFFERIRSLRPHDLKGVYINGLSISTTMGPGVKIDLNSF